MAMPFHLWKPSSLMAFRYELEERREERWASGRKATTEDICIDYAAYEIDDLLRERYGRPSLAEWMADTYGPHP